MLPERRIGEILRRHGLTIAVAESCTGGLVCDRLTDIPGSSAYFLAGMVTYSNRSKMEVLGVKESTLIEHGAVSEEVAAEMAEGVRSVTGVDVGLSTTGIAGPGGGTEEKPVGLVYMGFTGPGGTVVREEIFPGDRRGVKESATRFLLEMTVELLEESPK